jgi:hypothetical protein
MKYILGLIFEYHHYKKPSYLKIFTGDTLIDDIKLEDNIPFKDHNKNNHDDTMIVYCKKKPIWTYKKNTQHVNKCFLYEIDETALNDRMVFDITNDDNNYTNGFMNKFSYIKFQQIFLIPKEYFLNLEKLHDKILLQQKKQQTCKQGLKKNDLHFSYPGDLGLYDEKTDDYVRMDDLFEFKRGDSFVFELPIKYIDGIYVFIPRNFPPEYIDQCEWEMSSIFLSYYAKTNLLNIYNEDQ